jgi:VanZ family protein
VSSNQAFLLSIIFLAIFAFLDELRQSLIPGREADPFDFVMDCLGAFLVILLLWLRRKRRKVLEGPG